ncbi:MAG: hypothetical protein OXI76_03420 [Gemmatimonadota bacterium]|nr:hypothetical protein [Gemmatimonadota bacterium]
MRRLLATSLTALATSGCGLMPPPEMSGVLEVIVTDQEGEPVPDMPVAIWTSEMRKRDGMTDDDGRHVQQHLVRGSYRVEVAGQSESCYVEERETTECPFKVGVPE